MKTALIGYTGFVGSNLAEKHQFDDLYNSKNIVDIRGQSYDLVVSAGNRADSFRINNDQDADLREVDELIENLSHATIQKLVLISTICVYPAGGSPDEDAKLSPNGLTPYGQNRLHQERQLSSLFDTVSVRLPQLVGIGLKKGIVFDLANGYRVEHIRPQNTFQYYDVRRLWGDINIALENDLDTINIATPPVSSAEVAAEVFGRDIDGQRPSEPESPFSRMYTRDMTTKHADLFGGTGKYIYSKQKELDMLRAFVLEVIDEGTQS